MPIKHAALLQLRKDHKRAVRNQAMESELKTVEKHMSRLLAEQKLEEARQALTLVMKRFDRAAAKGIIHRHTASHTKSRLMRQLAKASTAQPQPQTTRASDTGQAPPAHTPPEGSEPSRA